MKIAPSSSSWESCVRQVGKCAKDTQMSPRNQFELNTTLTALRDVGETDSALDLLQTCGSQRLFPDRVSYNITLSALERSSRWKEALKIFDRMLLEGISPNVISFNTLLGSLARGKKWQAVLGLLNFERLPTSLRRVRVAPDPVSIGTAIAACARAVRWSIALALLAMPDQLGGAGHDGHAARRAETSAARCMVRGAHRMALTSALWACGRASRWQQGLQCLGLPGFASSGVESVDVDAAMMGAAVSACAFGQAWELAIAFLDVAERRSLSNAAVQRSAIAACELENWPVAMLLLRSSDVGAAGFSSAISSLAKAAAWELALCLQEEVQLPPAGLHAAVEAMAQAGKWVKTLELLRQLRHSPGASGSGLALAALTVASGAQLRSPFSVMSLYGSALRNWHAARGTPAQDGHLGNLAEAMDAANAASSSWSSQTLSTLVMYSCLSELRRAEPLEASELRSLGPCLVRSALDLSLDLEPTERFEHFACFAPEARREVLKGFVDNNDFTASSASASSLLIWLEFEVKLRQNLVDLPAVSSKAMFDVSPHSPDAAFNPKGLNVRAFFVETTGCVYFLLLAFAYACGPSRAAKLGYA